MICLHGISQETFEDIGYEVSMRITKFTGVQKLAEDISSVRNWIVHQGEFLDEEASVIVIEKARMFIQPLVTICDR